MASDSPWFESDHCFPTGRECVALLRELGRVDYIILSTHAYEHKLFIGPFSRKFPSAKVRIRIGEMVGGETDTTTGNSIIDVMRDIVSDEQCSDMKYVIFLCIISTLQLMRHPQYELSSTRCTSEHETPVAQNSGIRDARDVTQCESHSCTLAHF